MLQIEIPGNEGRTGQAPENLHHTLRRKPIVLHNGGANLRTVFEMRRHPSSDHGLG